MKQFTALAYLMLTVAFCPPAHADSVPRDRQGMTDNSWSDGTTYPSEHASYTPSPYDRDYYNRDSAARNRADNITGSNMGPAGRNSGFDDNEALHSSSSRHINNTSTDANDND